MHSDFWTLCEILQAAEIGITVLSTGILLKRDAERLVHYCDDVIVSLDGPREVHNRIRNLPRAYQKLMEGILAVREASRGVRIKGRCTVQRENFRNMRATVAAAHELALDDVAPAGPHHPIALAHPLPAQPVQLSLPHVRHMAKHYEG